MQDLTGANVSDDYTVDGTTIRGGVNRSSETGSVGTIPVADFHNMQLIEFQNIIQAADPDDSLSSSLAGDNGKQLITAIRTIIKESINPIGTVITHAAVSLKDIQKILTGEWMDCNGDTLVKEDYWDLWWMLGNSYTSEEDEQETTFKLPDLRNTFVMGSDNFAHIGDEGGASTVTLSSTNLPDHTHDLVSNALNPFPSGEGGGSSPDAGGGSVSGTVTGHTGTTTPLNTLPPYMKMWHLIRVK